MYRKVLRYKIIDNGAENPTCMSDFRILYPSLIQRRGNTTDNPDFYTQLDRKIHTSNDTIFYIYKMFASLSSFKDVKQCPHLADRSETVVAPDSLFQSIPVLEMF